MDIAQEARALLSTHGYGTAPLRASGERFSFEDANLLGAAFIYQDAAELLGGWEASQDQFLSRFAVPLRAAPDKLWNVYTIHLTQGECSAAQITSLFNIEQDFRGTRKIARSGIMSRDDLRSALLPLLPIQSLVEVRPHNARQVAQERLSSIDPALEGLFTEAPASEIAARLLERS